MERITPDELADVLVSMPVSTIAGLLSPHGEWRERAAQLVARDIVTRLQRPRAPDPNQLALNIG